MLCVYPHNWDHDRIMRSNRWRIINCVFRYRRDEYGGLRIPGPGPAMPISEHEAFREAWRDRGVPDYLIERYWRRHVAESKKKA